VRCLAVLLMLVQGTYLSYGVSPLMSGRCGCAHGADVPCDCLHHEPSNGAPAPCHLHAKPRPAAQSAAPHGSFRIRCGAIHPDLILLGLVGSSEAPEWTAELSVILVPTFSPQSLPEIFISPPKHRPKARV
jgi:hypothetical protein